MSSFKEWIATEPLYDLLPGVVQRMVHCAFLAGQNDGIKESTEMLNRTLDKTKEMICTK